MNKVHRPTERVINILSLVSQHKEGITFTEISNETSIPKGTLSPILKTLANENMLFLKQDTMKYMIGIKAFKIGYTFTEKMDIIKVIELQMKDIVDRCHEICQLGILDGKNVLYIEKVEPVQSIKLESSVGKTLPAYATALGRCLLSRYDDEYIRQMYKDNMEKITDKTVNDVDKLIEKINDVRENGISYEWGESNEQVMCLAVPINYQNKPKLSLSVSIPIYRAEKEKIDMIEELLLIKKAEIEREIRLMDMPDILL